MYERVSTQARRKELIDTIVADIKKNVDIAVIGLSGGADSTLVSSLCMLALGQDNVHGLSMPYNQVDFLTFNNRSTMLAMKLGIPHNIIPITDAVNGFNNGFPSDMSTLNAGNLRSRMRMVMLYSYGCDIGELPESKGKRVRVMGTGNRSEDFIGYDTKGGDALADIFPIGELYKYEVYALLDELVEMKVLDVNLIDRVPSAGLWDGQTDEGELGHTYNEMAPGIEFCMSHYDQMENDFSVAKEHFSTMHNSDGVTWEIVDFVWKRHIANRHKHMAPPVTKL